MNDTHTRLAESFPLADGAATKMFVAGIEARAGLTQRALAYALGYKSSVIISHMASGRAPIPIERAVDIAEALDLDRGAFLLAVLEQRYPHTDFRGLLSAEPNTASRNSDDGADQNVLDSLESIAGARLSRLPADKMRVMRDVLSDRDPGRRWLTLAELPIVEEMRRNLPTLRKEGVSRTLRHAILKAMGKS